MITVSRTSFHSLTKSPVDVLDEYATEVVRNRRETAAHRQALALRRIVRDSATFSQSALVSPRWREGDVHVRWVTREIEELLDAVAHVGVFLPDRMAFLELGYASYDLVEVERGLVTEAEELRDAVKARERLYARDDIAVRVFDMRHREHSRSKEDAEGGQ